ncbi:MAG: Gfo/Idh/MocA family oxidoreductase [Caldilineaceae bacterium]
MLRIGIIGYGARIVHIVRSLKMFGIPYQVTAVVDPRADLIRANDDGFLQHTHFYETADELLNHAAELDGVMIGTRCTLHTELACKIAPTKLPLFLEKPVAISFEQVRQLEEAYRGVNTPVVISFPLRLSPLLQKAKEIIDSGQIGAVEHVVAFNDVPYGHGYFRTWHRNYAENGGLWLQKFTHDVDYLTYLIGQQPKWVSAMSARRVFGGTMPWDLTCKECHLNETCPESPLVRFRVGFEEQREGYFNRENYCVFSEGFEIDDLGNCMIEYDQGAQLSYTQNFFARYKAERRGARLLGYKGALEFDWYQNQIKLFSHVSPTIQTIDFTGDMPHFGGDRELCYDFLLAMRDRKPSRAPLSAGILSALTCLWVRESATTRQFCEVKMPTGVLP